MAITLINNSQIGENQSCYLIAEVGTTCLGDYGKAVKLIQAAAIAGFNAIKFQLINPDQMSDKSVTYSVMKDGLIQQVNMYGMFKKLAFTEKEWVAIAEQCKKNGLMFFATVDHPEGVDLLEKIGVYVHKIGAWDVTYRSLIEHIGRTKKPMFVDLGPATQNEIDNIVDWYIGSGGTEVLFMHDFHTNDDNQMNLRAVEFLNKKYPWPAGFSSPGRDDDLDIAALAIGAAYIEKRLILDRNEQAFHAHESLEPEEIKVWVSRLKHVERALGRGVIAPSIDDLEGKKKYYRSVCTLSSIKAGEVFSRDNLGAKRPGTGLPPEILDIIYGKKAARDLDQNVLLLESDVK